MANYKWGRGSLVPGVAQIHEFCSQRPPGGRSMHIHMHRHTYVCTHMLVSCFTHTHAVLLSTEGETPAFPGQLTHRRTVSDWNSSAQPTANAVLFGQQCMVGPLHLWWIGFIHLFNRLPCSLSVGWNWKWRMRVIGLRRDCYEPAHNAF